MSLLHFKSNSDPTIETTSASLLDSVHSVHSVHTVHCETEIKSQKSQKSQTLDGPEPEPADSIYTKGSHPPEGSQEGSQDVSKNDSQNFQQDFPQGGSQAAPQNRTQDLESEFAAKGQIAAHLISYPLIKETAEFVDAIPGVKAVKNTAGSIVDPAVDFVVKQPYIQPVVKKVDHLGNQALSTIDNVTPFVKTTTYSGIIHVISYPCSKTNQFISTIFHGTLNAVDSNLVAPSVKLVHDFRGFYNKRLIDTRGKPLLRSSLDPVFRPINTKLENFTENHLAQGSTVSKDFSSEIERNVHLSLNMLKRSIPVVNDAMIGAFMAPCYYTKHSLDVFNDNLLKQHDRNIIAGTTVASYNSALDLTSEAWNEKVGLVKSVFGLKKD